MAWFEWRSSKEKKSAIKNIVAIMMADGVITDEEQACLKIICERLNVSPNELKVIMDAPDATAFVVPKKMRQKICQLVDIVSMILADGDINDDERAVFFTIAEAFGFNREIALDIKEIMINSINSGDSFDHTCDKVESELDFP
jgi:uncharacterized tellurite resistance protein B-like protein